MELRDYQKEGVNQLRKAFRSHQSALYQLPTGAGKSPIAGYIAAALAKRGRRVLILVHRRELVRQFSETLSDVGLAGQFGIIASGWAPTPWARFQLGTVQSAVRRQITHFDPRMVIVDEAHHMKAKSWETVVGQFPDAKLLGMTATPGRLDGKSLGDHFEVLIQGPSIQELVQAGWLAPMRVLQASQGLSIQGVKKLAGDYSKRELGERVTDRVVVAAAWAYQKFTPGTKAIFFGVNIPHSQSVAESLRSQGVRAEHLDAHTPVSHRDKIMEEFARGQVKVLCNCDLFSEGVDVPACETILAGRPTASVTLFLQQAGRAMRPEPGKTAALVDLAGNTWRLGLPDEERFWSLAGTNQGAPKDVVPPGRRIRCCGGCSGLYPSRSSECPHCGHPYVLPVPREVETDMIEAETRNRRKARHKSKAVRRRIYEVLRSGEGYTGLANLGRELGYSPLWACRMAENLKIKIPEIR